MEDSPAARRIAANLRHVLGGDTPEAGGLARGLTAAAVALPQLTPADVPQLTRALDHDNHEMRSRMKEFMKDETFTPVCWGARLPPRASLQRPARPPTHRAPT